LGGPNSKGWGKERKKAGKKRRKGRREKGKKEKGGETSAPNSHSGYATGGERDVNKTPGQVRGQ